MSDPAGNDPFNAGKGAAGLRFGILCQGTVFQQWQAAAIRLLVAHGHIPALLITDGRESASRGPLQRLFSKERSSMLFSFLSNRIFFPPAKKPVDLTEELHAVPGLACLVKRKGHSEYFDPTDIQAIRDHRLDFMLRFGFGIIRGDILGAARLGVWSFHHDDPARYRGGPPGFWEIVHGDPLSGAILQRLTEKLDAGIILERGFLRTIGHSYRASLDQLLRVSSTWPAKVADRALAEAGDGEVLQQASCCENPGPIFKVPGNLRTVSFLFRLAWNRLRFYRQEFLRAEFWRVGIAGCSPGELVFGEAQASLRGIRWTEHDHRSSYIADPSGFADEHGLHLLAEEYNYRTGRGQITGWLIGPDGLERPIQGAGILSAWGDPVRVVDSPLHHSYPYVFQYDGKVYCLPECHASGRVTLYRYDPVRRQATAGRVLLEGVEAVDPTLFRHDDRWWLFFTSREQSNAVLFIYHSRDLEGPYEPHLCNPVKTDVRSARPAGTPFYHLNRLYRPAQDCSLTYGGRIAVNRVLSLTPAEFSETAECFFGPDPSGEYNQGLHTLSAAGNFTLTDAKSYRFSLAHFIRRLRQTLHRKEVRHV